MIFILCLLLRYDDYKLINQKTDYHMTSYKLCTSLAITILIFMFLVLPYSADDLPNGKIAFASDRDGDYEIYVMDADGSNVTQLTFNESNDTQPSWSPDGTKIVFISDRDSFERSYRIYVMQSDGSNQQRLGFSDSREQFPVWSPDGSQIAYSVAETTDETYGTNIHIMNVDGSGDYRVTTVTGFKEYNLGSWSPDGTHLAYSTDVNSENSLRAYGTDYTTSSINLSNGEIQLLGGVGMEFYLPLPRYSPDGNQVVFHQNDATIYTFNIHEQNRDAYTWGYYPAWSPDGTQIVFSRKQDLSENMNLFVMNADGSQMVQLTDTPEFDNQYPSWQPVGIADVNELSIVED